MSNNSPTIRRNLSNLNSPLELRELNRQLEWLWKKLLGNLDEKSFSDGTVQHITTTVENQIIECVTSESIDTNLLSAAIAKMVVAVIGVCDADYLSAIDANVEQLLVRDGYGSSFTFRNLKVLYAQVANAMVDNLIIGAADGSGYYRISIDAHGILRAEPVEVTPEEVDSGISSGGHVIMNSEIITDELKAETILGSYALINKIRTEQLDVAHLFAREAFINALVTREIFADGGTLEIISKTESNIRKWFEFGENGFVIQRKKYTDADGNEHPGSIWRTVTDETGYHIWEEEEPNPSGSFRHDGLRTVGVTMGDIVCKRTETGGWVWTDAAQGGE